MSLVNRRSNRTMAKKVMYTPTKALNSYGKDKPKNPKRKINVDYELDKNKAIINKKDASEREFNVFLEYKKGNIVLTFSAAAFEEFRVITKNILLSSGLNINQTNTTDLNGVTVSESLEVKNGSEKIFVINFFNSTSRVLLNGNHVHISEFVSTHLRDVLQTLDHNKNFEQVNAKIREYCQSFLDIGKQKEESKNSDNCKCPSPL